MSASSNQHRLRELLADRATSGLTSTEQEEWAVLADVLPDEAADPAWELAAAAADQAFASAARDAQAMPPALRQRLLEQVEAWDPRQASTPETPAPAATPPATVRSIEDHRAAQTRPTPDRQPRPQRAWMPWLVAAAAVLLAAFGWLRDDRTGVQAPAAPDLVSQRNALERQALDLERWDWSTTEDVTAIGAAGHVSWSDEANEGYMTFTGLQPNDASVFQYQLWIFDSAGDERYPIDGGVFDIPAGEDEVVIRIDPRIPISDAALFAVTVERPGGVVVSDRSRISVLAQPPSA